MRQAGHLRRDSKVFGLVGGRPALFIDTFMEEEEGIAKANNSRYGLAASVWSTDFQRAQRVAHKIRAGTVWSNGHNRLMAEAETGGYRESGIAWAGDHLPTDVNAVMRRVIGADLLKK